MLRTLLPLYTPSTATIDALLQAKIPYPVTTQSTRFAWEGFHPVMTLSEVAIKQSLHIKQIKLVLSIKHLLFGRLQLADVIIDGAHIGIEISDNNVASLRAMPELSFDLNKTSHNRIPVERLHITNAEVDLIKGQQHYSLHQVRANVKLANQLKIRAHAQIQGRTGAVVDLSVKSSLFGKAPLKAYVHWVGGELALLYPSAKIEGQANIKTWLSLQAGNTQVTIDAKLNDLQWTTPQGKVLTYDKLGGLFHIKQQNAEWQISGYQAFWNESQHIDFHAHSEACQTETCWHLQAKNLPLKPLHDVVNLFSQNFAVYETKGEFSYLDMALQVGEKIQPLHAEIVFKDIGLFKPAHGGIAGVTGALIYRDQQGSLLLESERFNLHQAEWFSQVIPLTDVSALLHWRTQQEQLYLAASSIHAKLGETPITGSIAVEFTEGLKKSPHVETQWEIGSLKTQDFLNLLPKTMDIDLLEWLNKAIIGGDLEHTSMVMRGKLSAFPFDQHDGIFEVYSQLQHVGLDYTPGWPALNDLKANLLFRNRALYINAEHGFIEGGELLKAEAIIPDLLSPLPVLRIDTQLKSALENGQQIIQKSPLKETLGKELAPLALQGPMALALGLEVPLGEQANEEVKVRGIITLREGVVRVPDWQLEIPHLAGEVTFTENSVKAEQLTGYLFESPADFRISSMLMTEEPGLRVMASGQLVADRLLNWLNVPDFKQVTGDTDYQAELIITTQQLAKQVNLMVHSTLAGLKLELPVPLAKEANEAKLSECKIHFDTNDLIRIAFKYGDNLNVAYSLLHQNNEWRSMGGHIHLGEKRLAKYREDSILLIDGDIAELEVGKWQDFAKHSGIGAAKTGKSPLEPLVELNIAHLKMLGEDFTNARVEAQFENALQRWNIAFDGATLKGHMILPQADSQDIQIDLQKLTLSGNSEVSSFWENQEQTSMTQPIEIKIAELHIDKKALTQVQARFVPSESGYHFNNVKANIKNTTIELTGEWNYLQDKKVTTKGKIITQNIGEALLALGKEGTLKGANGTVDFSLEWEGTPAKIDYATLGGQAALSLRQGYVQGVNPGIGRILSLLNLDNVKRRLKLDFGDVMKSGFAFDELDAKLQFGKGKVSSNKIMLNGPSAKIEAFGQADLLSQGLSGEMVVMPDVTGSLPVAAAIAAGNPAIGAAVWVVDRMFGHKIQEINRFRYQILGSWQAPQVKEIPIISPLSSRG